MQDETLLEDPENLAVKFVKASLPELESRELAKRFRATLLLATLKHAYTFSEYYRSVLPCSVLDGSFALENLPEIPLLTKESLCGHVTALRTSVSTGILQYTTGTTGIPSSVYRSNLEISFLKQFYSSLQGILNGSTDNPRPLILTLANLYHGNVIDIPLSGYRISTGLFDPVLLNQIMYWLTTPHGIPGVENSISTITGLYQSVQWLTIMLIGKDFDFSKCKVKRIYSVGGFVTSRWKRLMETLWSAEIIPVYSLTEVFTHSNCCLLCGSYHFLPNVIPEMICPVEQTPMTEGTGELVLTGLYPFIQGQPAIRFATRDLFHLTKNRCPYGDSFEYLGRVDHSLIFKMPDLPPVVIGSAVIHDILDNEPDVATFPFFDNLPGIYDNGTVGKPKHTMTRSVNPNGIASVRVEIELQYNPLFYQEQAMKLKKKILRKICQKVPSLNNAMKEGLVNIELAFGPPGFL